MQNEIIQHEENNNLPAPQESASMSIAQLKERVALVGTVLKEVMQENQHYGIVPGCGKKPTLLKPGAEKLCTVFRLSPSFEITTKEFANAHREYQVITTLKHIYSGQVWAQGVACCSTLETKYARRRDGSPNPNIVDVYNTCLKIAKKRSLVDAVLTATGASDIFTQDVEEMKTTEASQQQPSVTIISAPKKATTQVKAPKEQFTSLNENQEKWLTNKLAELKAETNKEKQTSLYEHILAMMRKANLTEECFIEVADRISNDYLSSNEDIPQ